MATSNLTNEDKLKRFIYVGKLDPKYISGGPNIPIPFTGEIKNLLNELIKDSPKEFLAVISLVSEDKLVPHRSTLYQILACALVSEEITVKVKPDISTTILNICKSDKEFFDFIKYISSLRVDRCKLPPTVAKTVRKYYSNKSPQDLANSVALYNSYHSWTHKDLIKLSHVKSETKLKNVVIKYILFKEDTDVEEVKQAQEVLSILKKSHALRSTKDHTVAVPIISELKATINQVEPSLRKSAEVWNAVLPNMSLSEVLQQLPKLYKLGFLKKDTPTQALINESLTNAEHIKASGIHPVEVFIYMKNFEKGGKPLDPKLLEHLVKEKKLNDQEIKRLKNPSEVKCPIVLSNIQKCMYISCSNIQPLGKRYLVTIDVTDRMNNVCVRNKNITSLEAAVAFTVALLKTEKDVTVAVFKDQEISIVHLDRKGQFYEHVQKLRESKSNYLIPAAPIEWATSHKKHFDIFYNFVHHKEYHTTIPKDMREKLTRPAEALHKYRKKVNLQNAKLVTFCMASPHMVVADGSPNMLDIAGIDLSVPKVVEAFCRGSFL